MQAASDVSKPRIRKWSLQALGAIGNKAAAPLLIQALKDERMTVKLHAIRGLSRMKYKPAAARIRMLMSDPSGGIRVNAIDALIELEDRTVSGSVLNRSLADEKWYVRQHAAIACGKLGVKSSVSKLKLLIKNESKKAVLIAAQESLAMLSK
jgi:HEAT repeat protein